MARALVVRGLDEELVQRLKLRAARHNRSAEAEHREILKQALSGEPNASFKEVAEQLRALTGGRPAYARRSPAARGPRRAVSGFVVDASIAIKWVVDEPGAKIAIQLLDHMLAAPDLLGPECANILWKKVMRGELSPQEADSHGGRLGASPTSPSIRRCQHLQAAVAAAIALRHPAYDCIYLCLAERAGAAAGHRRQRLVEADVRLSRRFADLVVPLGSCQGCLPIALPAQSLACRVWSRACVGGRRARPAKCALAGPV